MLVLKSVIFLCLLFSLGDAKLQDTPKKCSIKKQDECFKFLFQKIISNKTVNTGKKIITIDPLEIVDDISVDIFDTLTATFSNGSFKNIGKCIYNTFQIDLIKKISIQDITCSLTIQGHLKLSGKSPATQDVLRPKCNDQDVNAYGKGKLQINNLNFKFEAPIRLLKSPDDGEIYLKLHDKNTKFQFDMDDAKISAEKFIIGKEDITETGPDYVNENFKWVLKTFGKTFVDTGRVIYLGLANQFFSSYPVKNYVLEDVSAYVDK